MTNNQVIERDIEGYNFVYSPCNCHAKVIISSNDMGSLAVGHELKRHCPKCRAGFRIKNKAIH